MTGVDHERSSESDGIRTSGGDAELEASESVLQDQDQGRSKKHANAGSDLSIATSDPQATISSNATQPLSQSSSPKLPERSFRRSLVSNYRRQSTSTGIELGSFGTMATDARSQTLKGSAGSHVEATWTPSPPLVGVKTFPGHSPLQKYRHWAERRYERARKFVLDIQDVPPTKDGRHIPLELSRREHLVDERTGKAYISNLIRSSKYTSWNFLPRQLFAQFSKLANFYFLVISILQLIPGLSTTGTYTTIAPLMFFVALSIAKEGYEDLRRHRLDQAENNREVQILRHAGQASADVPLSRAVEWTTIKWKALQVGDIVRLVRDEPVPADVVLLGSKGSNNIAYIETMAVRIEEVAESLYRLILMLATLATADMFYFSWTERPISSQSQY